MRRPSVPARIAFIALAAASVAVAAPAAAAAGPASTKPAPAREGFIVTLRAGANVETTASEWRDRGIDVGHVYTNAMRGFAGRMGPDMADRVRRDGRVLRVERDSVVRATEVQSGAPWGLDRIDQRVGPLDGAYSHESSAAGVDIYVVDTGVRPSHVDFGARVAPGYTAVADGLGSADCHGHGTHVAGTAAGAWWGAAKAATIVPVRVLSCTGSGSTSGVIAGLDWIVANHGAGTPAVVNMSLGGGASTALDTAVRTTIADGVTVVVAAGNENVDACTKSPARVVEAVTVAATTAVDARASFSNWGPCVDLFAPGSSIRSAHHSSDTATATMSGTSMAAPHVSGIAALYLETSSAASPATVHAALNDASTVGVVSDLAGTADRLAHSRFAVSPPPAVVTPPSTPGAPTATAAGTGVALAWAAPADGGSAITGNAISVHRAADGVSVKTVWVSGRTTSFTVTGLEPDATYYASVRSINAVGSSGWSPPSNTVATRSGSVATPPATPAAPNAAAASTGLALSWAPPDDGGSAITGNNIRVHRASDGAAVKSIWVSGSARAFTVTGLAPGGDYFVTLRSINALGSSAWSPPSVTVAL